jgi:hypothetical protein
MKTKIYFLTAVLILLCKMTFAIPAQEEFYHKYYTIECKGFGGKVLTRRESAEWISVPPLGFISPAIGEHVTQSYFPYSGGNSQKWIIAPVSPNSSEFYIINKMTGYPLMVDGTNIRCNTSGITDDRQRFKFKNVNGDYFQLQSASTAGGFYLLEHRVFMLK